MSFKRMLRKVAKFILSSSSDKKVFVNISQIRNGEILKDKKILITGGSSGIGYSIAEKCLSEGAIVTITGRNESKLIKAKEKLNGNIYYIVHDNKDISENGELLDKAEAVMGGLDVLVNNAGISLHEGNILNVSKEGFESTFDINLKSSYFLTQEFIKKVDKKNLNAQILFISSETGEQCYDIPYGLTKASINSLVGALSRRLYKEGIRVNAIAPGVTESEMTKEYADTKDGNMYRNCASDRIFKPEEIAEVACFLLSDASKCISGEVIHCNAGNHLKIYWEE